MSSLASSRNSTNSSGSGGSAFLKNYFSVRLDNPLEQVITGELASFDQVKKGDYVKVISSNPFYLMVTKVEAVQSEWAAANDYFHLKPSLTGMGYSIEVVQGRRCKTVSTMVAALSPPSAPNLRQGDLVGFAYEKRPIEAAIMDMQFGGARSHKHKEALTVDPIPEGFKVVEYSQEGLRMTVLKEVQWSALYPPPEMPPVLRRYFAIEIPRFSQLVLSDELKALDKLEKGDRLKVICQPASIYLDIEEIVESAQPGQGYLQIESASDGYHSLEVCNGQTLRTITASPAEVKEIDLGKIVLATLYPNRGEFEVVAKDQGITFTESAHKIHTVVVGFKFGVGVQDRTTSGYSINKFLDGYEIHLDDSRGKSVITLEKVSLLCTLLV